MTVLFVCLVALRLAHWLSAQSLVSRTLLLLALLPFLQGLLPDDLVAQYPGRGSRTSGQQYRIETTNFVIHAPDQRLANQVATEAERYRRELSQRWLGYEIKTWPQQCPIQVQLDMHAGGETSFAFVSDGAGRGTPTNWQMKIFGPPDRLVDAVLPHEITHTIFATHFGRPLPRWADEGACTTVEHESERAKNHQMLLDFLNARPSRGIPFNRMFTMRQYPHDILPLYAQGHSLAKFLIMKSGHREFLDYLEEGMQNESRPNDTAAWDRVTDQYYGYRDLSELQLAWLDWVKKGSIETPPAEAIASAEPDRIRPTSPEGSLVSFQTPVVQPGDSDEPSPEVARFDQNEQQPFVSTRVAAVPTQGGWYARQMNRGQSESRDGNSDSSNRASLDSSSDRSSSEQPGIQDSRVDRGTIWQ